nr:MAG TPA: hypothetical protein [Caudoviricetes sp.]
MLRQTQLAGYPHRVSGRLHCIRNRRNFLPHHPQRSRLRRHRPHPVHASNRSRTRHICG